MYVYTHTHQFTIIKGRTLKWDTLYVYEKIKKVKNFF